jgi:pimeloyl-ACP methyl ester carboxylesterase
VIWTILVVAAGLIALPFLAEMLRIPMSAARQGNAPGEIAQLPQGATHYRWSGREGNPVAVCIHGLSTPSYVFAATERSLASLGYRVLSYDLYGRGYSARVRKRQTLGFHLGQLRALLKHLGVDGPLVVLGFSMGGQIATGFAAREDRVEKLVVVAPTGLAESGSDSRARMWTAPLMGDWLTRVFGGIALRRELVEHKSLAMVIPDFEDRQAAETRMRGYLPALLSSRRHILSASSSSDHKRVAALGIPVLAIWGAADPVIPRRSMAALAALNPEARHVEIKDAGHTLLQTHPSEVAAALRDFLAG